MLIRRAHILWLFLLAQQLCSAQIILNEVSGKNNKTVTNNEGEYTDWIEVYNTSSVPVQLNQFYLSDDAALPLKWQMPNILLPANSFIVFFAEEELSANNYFNFRISQDGETLLLSNASGIVQSQLNIPFHRSDHSYGNYQENPLAPFLFENPTPGASNTSTAYKGYAPDPQFSPASRLLFGPLNVAITNGSLNPIRYTTNGVVPTLSSAMINGTVNVNTTTSFLARSFGDSLLPSAFVGSSYIVHDNSDLPVVTLQADPDSLFDPILGMHVTGPNADSVFPYYGANYWAEREIPVYVEYFTTQGIKTISQLAGLQVHGGRASRTHDQKPLRLTARSVYGDKDFDQAFFEERPGVDEFKRIVLRNSGSDFCYTNLRDGFWHQLALHDSLNVDVLAFQPADVYLNGEYWGVMNIRERIDDDHIASVYGANKDSVLIMEEENWQIQGDTMVFYDLNQFVLNNDMNNAANWQQVQNQLDIPSAIDYFGLQMFAGNPDWPSNNLKYWKPSATQGKWRYFFFDLDASMNAFGWFLDDTDSFDYLFNVKSGWMHTEFFRKLLENNEFKRLFVNRLADMLNTSFTPDHLATEWRNIINELGGDRAAHWNRWCWQPLNWSVHALGVVPDYMQVRQKVVRDDIEQWFSFPQQHRMKFEVFPPGAGEIQLNSLRLDTTLTGIYFQNNEIDISVLPRPGKQFDRWVYGANGNKEAFGTSLTINPEEAQTVTAYFTEEGFDFNVFPNPAKELLFVSLVSTQNATGELFIQDLFGRTLATSTRQIQPGMNKFELNTEALASGSYVVSYRDQLTTRSSLFIRE